MEKEFFEYENADEIDMGHMMFYNPTLKVDLGKFKAGQTFNSADINYQNGILTLWEQVYTDRFEVCGTFKLGFKVLGEV